MAPQQIRRNGCFSDGDSAFIHIYDHIAAFDQLLRFTALGRKAGLDPVPQFITPILFNLRIQPLYAQHDQLSERRKLFISIQAGQHVAQQILFIPLPVLIIIQVIPVCLCQGGKRLPENLSILILRDPVGRVGPIPRRSGLDDRFLHVARKASAAPADEGVSGAFRVLQRNIRTFNGIFSRIGVVGRQPIFRIHTMVQVVAERIHHYFPVRGIAPSAHRAAGDDDFPGNIVNPCACPPDKAIARTGGRLQRDTFIFYGVD